MTKKRIRENLKNKGQIESFKYSESVGATIAGHKIAYECRKIKSCELTTISGQHKGKKGNLIKATCVIEQKFRFKK